MRIPVEIEIPRLDKFLTDLHPELPRSRWEAWIREGNVLVDGEPATKPGTRVKPGKVIETEMPERTPPGFHLTPEDFEVPTLFEDSRLWIVDKPAGLVVHPAPGHPNGTLVNALLGRLKAQAAAVTPTESDGETDEDEIGAAAWPGMVHRLDRYTTGCIAMAKDQEAQAHLQAQFKARTVEKRYLALCRMSRRLPELGSLLVDEPIARHRVDRMKMTINGNGRPSQTRVKVLAKNAGLALVECELLTGRTHQIRVHLGHLGAPILGDPLYGGAPGWLDADKVAFKAPHPLLHAWKLSIDHPGTGERLHIQAPIPEAYRELLVRLEMVVPER